MEHLSNVMLIESQRRSLEREVEQARLERDLPRRPVAWRVYLVMAIILVGMIVWWIH